ncbi:MAG: tyrosine-type recombinase/integrase [Victivallaceae bacterium]|nr:tyrosine-type recombinase/integrase [Victivallaceae bacterium]
MALVKKGKIYHIKYRDLSGTVRTKSTGDTVREEAEKKEHAWMAQIRAERQRRKHGDFLNTAAVKDRAIATLDNHKGRARLKLAEALDRYRALYGEPAFATRYYFPRFCRDIGLRHMDEVTPDIAAKWLWDTFPDSGKSFNEAKIGCNVMFSRLLVYAGITASPFAAVPRRKYKGDHQRSLSPDDVRRLIAVAAEPLKSAIMIAWHTGLRGTSCLALRWDEIHTDAEHGGKYILHLPPKTARFNRAVKIPVHPELDAYLAKLPKSADGRVLGFAGKLGDRDFMRACEQCGIASNESGVIRFGSIRKKFIQRCDAAGIRRSATRGMAGQTSDNITDIYSEDYEGAVALRETPGLFDQ